MSKICSKCGVEKPLTMFETLQRARDGHLGVCRDCRNKYVYRVAYEKNKTNPHYREQQRRGQRLYEQRHPEIIKAHQLAKRHKTELLKEACERCGTSEGLHMHHPDYSKPLEVVTLCHACHELTHHRGVSV